MADIISRLKLESGEFDSKIKRAGQELMAYSEHCRKTGLEMGYANRDAKEFAKALGNMQTTSATARGKISELSDAFVNLRVMYKNMTDEEKNNQFGKNLAASLEQLKTRINEAKADLTDVTAELNGNSGGGGLSGALDSIAGKFGLSIDQVTKFGGVVGVATTALNVAKDAFFQSEGNIDEWGRTVEGAKGAYNIFLDTLNNGNWSNFFSNLSKAIKGGRDLYDVFDRLGSIKSNNAAAIAIVQKEIAELRLAKQQGENVDAKLKSATERLKALQGQSVSAGQRAGTQSAFQTIRNGVNSIGGAGVNDATIKYVVQRIMENGQSEFDKYARNYSILREKGMVTRTQTIDDSQGGTYERKYREFNIKALTKEQQKQYAIAKAVTEGETRIQKGIAAYAQAVSEGTSSAREAFKGNRYALQGSGGATGGRGSSGSKSVGRTADDIIREQGLAMQRHLYAGVDGIGPATDTGASAIWRALVDREDKRIADRRGTRDALEALNKSEGITPSGREKGKSREDRETLKTYKTLLNGVSQLTDGLSKIGIDIPDEIQSVIGVIQGVMQVIEAVNTIIGVTQTAELTANTVAMASLTAALWANTAASVIPFANGGIVPKFAGGGLVGRAALGMTIPGNSYSGDNLRLPVIDSGGMIGVNSGEVILNRAQADIIASDLQGSGIQNMQLETYVDGRALKIVLNNDSQSRGKGRYVTSNKNRG